VFFPVFIQLQAPVLRSRGRKEPDHYGGEGSGSDSDFIILNYTNSNRTQLNFVKNSC
jgi:hypothetical protein